MNTTLIFLIAILSILLGFTSISLFFAARKLSIAKNQLIKLKYTDIDKFALFTMDLALFLQTRAHSNEFVLKTLMKIRPYELKEMVINNLKDFNYSPEGAKHIAVDTTEISNKIGDMLINFEMYVNDYMKTKYY